MDNQNMYNQNNVTNNGSTPDFTKYLVLSILETLCCCQITGIIGIIFAVLFNSAYKSGNTDEYESKKKITKTVLWIGLALGLVVNLLLGFAYGASIVATIMGA